MSQPVTSRRFVPYPDLGAAVYVPEALWYSSIVTARDYGKERAEALVLWGGVVSGGALTVTGIYIPRHSTQGYHVALNRTESRWLVRRLWARDEKLVAQVHSHPCEAFHSAGDDAGAASFHAGYLSIVIPNFGCGVRWPADCAVFEYTGSSFLQLDSAEIASRIVIVTNPEERGGP